MKNKVDRRKHGIIWFVVIATFILQFACNFPIIGDSFEKELPTVFSYTVEAIKQIEKEEVITSTPTQVSSIIATIPFLYNGLSRQFIICKVGEGDLLKKYAETFNTSVGAIIRVNYALSLPLWSNALLVIPVGFTDVEQLPYFQPYRVTAEVITIKDLALELDANLDELIKYNFLDEENEIYSGKWLIIPRVSPGY